MSSVGGDGPISHPSPVAYPPYIPPPERPHPSTICIRNVTIIDGSENCRRFPASVYVRDGIIASVERTNDLEGVSTPVVSKQENGIKGSDMGGAGNQTLGLGAASEKAERVLEIDGSGLVLCPGFIDMHAHSDLHLLSHPSHIPKVSQGITLEVVGQDGIGYSPLVGVEAMGSDDLGVGERGLNGEKALEYVRKQITGWNGNPKEAPAHWEDYRHTTSGSDVKPMAGLRNSDTVQADKGTPQPFFTWLSTAKYLDTLDAHRLAVNVAVLIPQGNLRLLVLGPDPPLTSASTTSSTNPSDSTSASQAEISQMRAILRKGLAEGAVGMSSGLTYVPGMYADYGELKALCEELVLARSPSYPGVDAYTPYYAPHHRSYGLNAISAYEEMLRLGADTGAPIHLTHATLNFPPNSGKADELLSMIAGYESRGVDISLDTYPYTAGSTTLAALLPSWAAGGGVETVMKRLRGEGEKMLVLRDGKEMTLQGEGLLEAIREDVCVRGSDGCNGLTVDWDTIEIAGLGTASAKNNLILAGMVGKTVGENARSFCTPTSPAPPTETMEAPLQDLTDPFQLFLHILISDSLSTTIIQHVGHEDNVRKMMRHRNHMFGTDAILAPTKCHPRGWGSTGRYLGWYARDIWRTDNGHGKEWVGPDGQVEPVVSAQSPAPFSEEFSLEEVIPHLTSRPARRLGLLWDPITTPFTSAASFNDESGDNGDGEETHSHARSPRGLVAPGYAADLVLFNPNTVRDRATFNHPSRPCAGIEWVLVNGVIAVERGTVTGARGGRTVRRDAETGLVW